MYEDQYGEFICGYWGLKGWFVCVPPSFIRSSYIYVMHLLFYSVNGIPRPPEHTLVAEFRRELTQLRDRVNYLLNRLDTSDDSESPKGEQQQPVEKRNVQGLFPVNNDDSIICKDVWMIFFQHGDIIVYW